MKKKRSFVIMIISVLIGAVLLSACQNGGGSRGLMGSEPQSSRVLQEYYELIDIKLEENEILKNSSNISYYFPSFFVSPYAEDEEIDALAEMLSDVSMDKMLKRDFASVDICCYSDLLRVDLTKKCGKDQMLEQIGELFDKESPKG